MGWSALNMVGSICGMEKQEGRVYSQISYSSPKASRLSSVFLLSRRLDSISHSHSCTSQSSPEGQKQKEMWAGTKICMVGIPHMVVEGKKAPQLIVRKL